MLEYAEQFRFEKIGEFCGRTKYTLLDEAIRFYNFGIDPSTDKTGVINKTNWTPFTPDLVKEALSNLCDVLTNSSYRLAYRLALMKKKDGKLRAIHLPSHLNDAGKQFTPHSNNVGLLASHTFLDTKYRNAKKKRALEDERSAKNVYFRELEKLEEKLVSLRKLTRQKNVEQHIRSQYSKFIDGPPDNALFDPGWGGSYIIRTKKWNPKAAMRPYTTNDKSKLGPTEKIYYALSSAYFHPKLGEPRNRKIELDEFLTEVEQYADAIKQILPPLSLQPKGRLKHWYNWINNLQKLESCFRETISFIETPIPPTEIRPAVQCGLPCALVFIGILRAYIADLMARAFMVALPLAINRIYENVNGYLGVALWEALSGRAVSGGTEAGCLQMMELQPGCLGSWRKLPLEAFSEDQESIEKEVTKQFREIMSRPLVPKYEKRSNSKKVIKALKDSVSFDEYDKYLLRFPPIRKSFFVACEIKERQAVDPMRFSARFVTQAHIFVAFQILRKALAALNLDMDFDKEELVRKNYRRYKSKYKPYKPHRRYLKNFNITAGSYLWGGKKPPHQTHRDGGCVDLAFGPVLVPWPRLKEAEDWLTWFYLQDELTEFWGKQSHKGYGKKYKDLYPLFVQPLVVCSLSKDVSKAKQYDPKRTIFRPLVRGDIYGQLKNEIWGFCKSTLTKELLEVKKDEEQAYDTAEKALAGSPHFIDPKTSGVADRLPMEDKTESLPDEAESMPGEETAEPLPLQEDWQRTHIAHVAVLLSAPRHIVFASPIVHLRAMLAIRRGFEDNPKLFKLASEIVLGPYFSFLPYNHHNHWHVDYFLPYWAKTHEECEGDKKPDPVERFEYFFPLWCALGIDLSPFLDYLKTFSPKDYPALAVVVKKEYNYLPDEHKNLKEACKRYMEEYEKIFGSSNDPNSDAVDAANALAAKLFRPFEKPTEEENSSKPRPLLTPMTSIERGQTKLSNELSKHAIHSSKFLNFVGLKVMAEVYKEVDIHYESEISLPPFFGYRYIEAYIEQLKKDLGF